MKKIIVSSKNPVKIEATLDGFKKMFPNEEFEIEGILPKEQITNQPKTDQETFNGALNRVEGACQKNPKADFWVGIEGGVEEKNNGEMESFGWVIIQSKQGKIGKSRTGTFFLPKKTAELIKQGKELGEADDIVFRQKNSKQKNGAIGLLTNNVIDRKKYYTDAVIFALIPFKNMELY